MDAWAGSLLAASPIEATWGIPQMIDCNTWRWENSDGDYGGDGKESSTEKKLGLGRYCR